MIFVLLLTVMQLRAQAHDVQPTQVASGKVSLLAAWTKCSADAECIRIYFGCSGITSANRKYRAEAEAHAFSVGGDPRVLNCAHGAGRGIIEVLCRNARCGAYEYSRDPMPQGSEPPSCRLERWGSGASVLGVVSFWGPTKVICEKKCRDELVRSQPMPKGVGTSMLCILGNRTLFRE